VWCAPGKENLAQGEGKISGLLTLPAVICNMGGRRHPGASCSGSTQSAVGGTMENLL